MLFPQNSLPTPLFTLFVHFDMLWKIRPIFITRLFQLQQLSQSIILPSMTLRVPETPFSCFSLDLSFSDFQSGPQNPHVEVPHPPAFVVRGCHLLLLHVKCSEKFRQSKRQAWGPTIALSFAANYEVSTVFNDCLSMDSHALFSLNRTSYWSAICTANPTRLGAPRCNGYLRMPITTSTPEMCLPPSKVTKLGSDNHVLNNTI